MATLHTPFASARTRPATRDGSRRRRPRIHQPDAIRPRIVERARERLAAGFYDQPDILSAALDRMFTAARAEAPSDSPVRPHRRRTSAA